jgi:hypothetical protein
MSVQKTAQTDALNLAPGNAIRQTMFTTRKNKHQFVKIGPPRKEASYPIFPVKFCLHGGLIWLILDGTNVPKTSTILFRYKSTHRRPHCFDG